MSGPLEGVRVVDLTTVLMGPYATQIMADMGADVIKVEPPAGDTVRGIGPMRNPGMGHIFLHVNRNKRSLVLDLKHVDGMRTFLDLVATADVLIYNIRPQAMARLGLDYERLGKMNPRLIHAGLHGYGEIGPYAGKPAYDDLIQGVAAVPSLMAKASGGEPRYVPLTLADRTVGLAGANAILAAIIARTRTGVGQSIEIPMFETMVQFVLSDHMAGETFLPPIGPTGYPRLLVQERRPYRTSDGYLCALVYSDKQWQRFLALIGKPELYLDDPRFGSIGKRTEHINDLYAMVGAAMGSRSTAEWMVLLEQADIPAMPLHDIDSLIADPHLAATGFVSEIDHPSEGRLRQIGIPVRLSGTPVTNIQRPAPRLGEHSAEVLAEIGYSSTQIAQLAAAGATHLAAPL
jgi:crotonobetainyl-CoA:carnitine CoA-transferase CaiB-like acyl-CoA transferase